MSAQERRAATASKPLRTPDGIAPLQELVQSRIVHDQKDCSAN